MCSLEWIRVGNIVKLIPKDGILHRIKAFLTGESICIRCDKKYHSVGSFGPLLIICPKCYEKEPERSIRWLWRRSVWTGKIKPTAFSS